MKREFTEVSERYGSKSRVVARVYCRVCGVSSSLPVELAPHGKRPPHDITKRLEEKGWCIGANEAWDYCPAHNPKHKGSHLKMVDTKTSEVALLSPAKGLELEAIKPTGQVAVTPPPPPAPKQMTRDDRRIIFAKLNDVYLNESYRAGWSDQRVATELGCDLNWVAEIRKENFGDRNVNEDAMQLINTAQKLLDDVLANLKKMEAFRDEVMKLYNKADIPANFPHRLAELEKELVKVKKSME